MNLFNYFRSSSSYRVRLALHFKGIAFQYWPVNLLKGEQHSEQYVKKNPLRQVPLLEDGSISLTQSLAILLYLEGQYPHPPLLPQALEERVRVIEFCEMIGGIQPLHNLSTLKKLEQMFGASEEIKKKWVQDWLTNFLPAIESWLDRWSMGYCYKKQPTLADCFFLPFCFVAQRFGVEFTSFLKMNQLYESLKNLPWAKEAHPQNQIDAC